MIIISEYTSVMRVWGCLQIPLDYGIKGRGLRGVTLIFTLQVSNMMLR